MKKIRGVIFDVDGTLVDSNDAHAQAWVEALALSGYQVEFERIRQLIGKGGDKLLPETTGLEKDSPEGRKISEQRGKIFKEKYLAGLQPTPGAKPLLERMRASGLKMVIASSAQEDELDDLLNVAAAKPFMADQASSGDAKNSKPDPDIVQVALGKIGLEAEESLMVGDTPYDIEAASKAGVRTVAFRSGGWSDHDLEGAIAIFDDPADFLAHFEQVFTP